MKKQNFKNELNFGKKVISNFESEKVLGGLKYLFTLNSMCNRRMSFTV
jgi:hypothetical protein